MTFNSYFFILYFLPLAVIAYFLTNRISITAGKIILILTGILFYSYAGFTMLAVLVVSIIFNYFFSIIIKSVGKLYGWMLSVPVAANVMLLLLFKYAGFVITNPSVPEIILPLGISFYTFQQIAYIVSVSQGKITNVCLIDYLCYILYFPKLLMGPLMEPVDFICQINDPERKKVNFDNLACGAKLFSIGLVKKVLLADTFAGASNHILGSLDTASSFHCILLVLVYSFDIYFDFSAYSDMATGVSSMMNIDLPINFNSPYKALFIRDFWKRWHISLTKFLTEYIFIPLGGSRKGMAFTYINTMIVFMISGMWHGANWTFILWGLLHGLFCCLDRAFEKIAVKVFRPVRWLFSFSIVSMLWLLFCTESILQWIVIMQKIFAFHHTSSGAVGGYTSLMLDMIKSCMDILHLSFLYRKVSGVPLVIMVIIAFIICIIPENAYNDRKKLNLGSWILATAGMILGVMCLGTGVSFVYYGF